MRTPSPIPKQPVLDFSDLRPRPSDLPSLLDLPFRLLTNSGRSALRLALEILNVGPGDSVLVPTYHCPTMIAPVESLGAMPLFYPITELGLPDMDYLESIKAQNIKAMLFVHFFGLPRPIAEAAAYCDRRGIAVIEDCAHSFFGRAGGVPVGTTGTFAIGSLPKFFPVITGGILASATRPIDASRVFRPSAESQARAAWDIIDLAAQSGRLGAIGSAIRIARRAHARGRHTHSMEDDIGDLPSETVRLQGLSDSLLRPLALSQVERLVVMRNDLSSNVNRRRRNYHTIACALGDLSHSRPLALECDRDSAPYVVPVLVPNADRPYRQMRAAGLPVFRWDRSWPHTPAYEFDFGHRWARGLIQIACHQSLRKQEMNRLLEQLTKVLRR